MNSKTLPYLLLLPATLYLLVFFVYPFVQVAFEAFQTSSGLGVGNFQTMLRNFRFWPSVRNTLLLAVIVVPLQLIMALGMASVVAGLKTARNTVLYIFTIPLGLSDLAAGLIWLAIFEQSGFLNSALVTLGVTDKPVLLLSYQNVPLLFLAVVIAEVWRATAIMMVIIVSGMGLIPREYYEAAEVFGAGRWHRFIKVTLPMLRPSLQTALILRTINAFEVFAVVAALGGTILPVLMSQAYDWQFNQQNGGVAAALALVVLAISVGSTLVFLRLLAVPKGATP